MADPFQLARRTHRMNPSAIREILKLTERPGVLSMAGGLPAPEGFPVDALREACARVLATSPREALQYAASEGHAPLRAWVAARLTQPGWPVAPEQVLITSGSQQGLDLIGKVLVDPGAPVAVESPTYLGALQAFDTFEPQVVALDGDAEGPDPAQLARLPRTAPGTRFVYLLPNFQNPTGRLMSTGRRDAVAAAARAAGVPIVEDDPYGELWYDAPPPAPLAARWPEGTVYLGSFSKVLAPGLRLGFLVAPPALMPKLLHAKQASDLHTASFGQRLVHEVLQTGLLDTHLPALREVYRARRDAMVAALRRHLPPGCALTPPRGGMFCWLRLPAGLDAEALLPAAVEAGVAYVPGAPFFPGAADPRTLRLGFATLTPERIEEGVARLGRVFRAALAEPQACTTSMEA